MIPGGGGTLELALLLLLATQTALLGPASLPELPESPGVEDGSVTTWHPDAT